MTLSKITAHLIFTSSHQSLFCVNIDIDSGRFCGFSRSDICRSGQSVILTFTHKSTNSLEHKHNKTPLHICHIVRLAASKSAEKKVSTAGANQHKYLICSVKHLGNYLFRWWFSLRNDVGHSDNFFLYFNLDKASLSFFFCFL